MHSMIKFLNARLLSNGIKTNYRVSSTINKYVTQPVYHLSTTVVTQVNRDVPPILDDSEEPNDDIDTESYLKVMDLKEPPVEPQPKPDRPKPTKPFKKYSTYLVENELSAFPLSELRKQCRTPPHTLRVGTELVSDKILAHLSNHRNRNVPLFEINPGPGFLSTKLLEAGEDKLKLFDESEEFNDTLRVSTIISMALH